MHLLYVSVYFHSISVCWLSLIEQEIVLFGALMEEDGPLSIFFVVLDRCIERECERVRESALQELADCQERDCDQVK